MKLANTRKRSTTTSPAGADSPILRRYALAMAASTSPASDSQGMMGREASERFPFWNTSTMSTSIAQRESTISGRSAQK
jgi:hypothetical protein